MWVARDLLTPQVARELSEQVGGMVYLGPTSLTWVMGRNACRMVNWELREEIERAQAHVAALTGACEAVSPGGMARELLEWVGHSQTPSSLARAAVEACQWHYVRTRCGHHGEGAQYDIRRAYHQLLQRLPGPEVVWAGDEPMFGMADPEVEERWAAMVRAVEGLKQVRNCVVGCMLGGGPGVHCWHKGQVRRLPGKPGPMYNTAALVVRTLYEVCELEAESGEAVYANTDSVMLLGGQIPTVWPDLALGYRLEAAGEVEVRGIGSYRVGPKETGWYRLSAFVQGDDDSPSLAGAGTWRWLARA